jgi:hypothetical protein
MALSCSLSLKVCFALLRLLRHVPKLVLDKPFRACLTLAKGLPCSLFGCLSRNFTLNQEIIPGAIAVVKLDPNNMDPNYLGPRRMSFRFGELCCAAQLCFANLMMHN